MVALFEPIKKSRLSEHVSMILIKMIKDKVLKTGEQLPSERELAEQFQVSRASVREALKVMENIGYIEFHEAIRDRNADAAANLMNQHIRKACENAVSKQALAHVNSGE